MTAEQKANELIDKFKDHVNPYIGSGMLINSYDDDAILWQSIQCAIKCVDFHLEEISKMKLIFSDRELHLKSWQSIKQILTDKLK